MHPPQSLNIRLLGRFSVEWCERSLGGLDAAKVQELFSYLLVHRGRAHARTLLASLLWAECPQPQAQKYLRQGVWQLQTALGRTEESNARPLLVIEPEWIHVNRDVDLTFDVAVLESAFQAAHGIAGETLPTTSAVVLRQAIAVYRGDLLEGWHQDWCLCDRERLQTMYLSMLNKLMAYSEAHHEYEAGVSYGDTVLRYDRAHERTHQRLMRIHYLAGDRTAALRQFRQCAAALHEELGVKPSRHTLRLHEQIRSDDLDTPPASEAVKPGWPSELLEKLRVLHAGLADFERQLQGER
jgi:DNA-binding SARP family transcriptional activator